MNFSVHCHKIANKAKQALGMIKHNLKYVYVYKVLYDIIQNICGYTWSTASQFGIPIIIKTKILNLKKCNKTINKTINITINIT